MPKKPRAGDRRDLLVGKPQVSGLSTAVTVTGSYSRAAQFRPLRMSRADLVLVVKHIRNFVADANAGLDSHEDSLRLAGVNHSFEVNLKSSQATVVPFERAPEVIDSVRYSYLCFRPDAAIRKLTLNLRDFEREVDIDGAKPEQIDGLIGVISRDMRAHSTWFGGFNFRAAAGLIMWLTLGLGVPLAFAALGSGTRMPIVASVGGNAIGVFLLFGPWQRWLPGTAVYSESASWLVRNNALVSAVGVILTVLTFVLSLAYSAYLARPTT